MKIKYMIPLAILSQLIITPSFANDSDLIIKGQITNYNKCYFDNKKNAFKCSSKTAKIRKTEILSYQTKVKENEMAQNREM